MKRALFRAWIAALAAAALGLALPAWSEPPKTLPFQGHLATSAGQPLNATINVTFTIYAQPTGGAALWTEPQAVAVAQGRFSVILGTTVPISLPFDVPYYLGMAVGGDPEMTPRAALTLAPYALYTPAARCAASDLRECYTGTLSQLDVGVCRAGRRSCVGGAFGACTGQVLPTSEACNGLDDNCDGLVDNGATCSALNNANRACTGGNCVFQSCQPNWGNCDSNTANGCEVNLFTATNNCGACGTNCATRPHVNATICSGGNCVIQSCEAGWGHCDSSVVNGCEQTLTTNTHCAGCNISCARNNATASCSTGSCQLGACNSGFANIDGNPNNGCEFDLDPGPLSCSSPTFLGTISGDTGAGQLSNSNIGERVYRVRLTEDDSSLFSDVYLSATVTLTVPAGADYDLYVYCTSCNSSQFRSSALGGSATETVQIRKDDDSFADESFDIYIEVRFYSGTSPANWNLSVFGNTSVSTVTCN